MLSERQYLRTTDDKVVRHTDINELKRLHQTLRYGLICLAGRGIAGGVVMRQYHCCCIEIQGAFDHLTGMYLGAANGTGKQGFMGNQLVLLIQISGQTRPPPRKPLQ